MRLVAANLRPQWRDDAEAAPGSAVVRPSVAIASLQLARRSRIHPNYSSDEQRRAPLRLPPVVCLRSHDQGVPKSLY